MKFKIVICDNDPEDLQRNCSLVNRFFDSYKGYEGEIFAYSSSAKLAVECDQIEADLYLLDIMMPDLNGIELGTILRRTSPREPIIYTTSSREFAFEAYGVHAMFYLEKPVEYEKLEEALRVALHMQEKYIEKQVPVNTKNGMTVVETRNIVYIENAARSAVYHLRDGSTLSAVCNRTSFEDSVGSIAEDADFLHPHKSYFVNMQYIQFLTAKSLVLDDKTEIPVSRQNVPLVKKAYLRHMTRTDET